MQFKTIECKWSNLQAADCSCSSGRFQSDLRDVGFFLNNEIEKCGSDPWRYMNNFLVFAKRNHHEKYTPKIFIEQEKTEMKTNDMSMSSSDCATIGVHFTESWMVFLFRVISEWASGEGTMKQHDNNTPFIMYTPIYFRSFFFYYNLCVFVFFCCLFCSNNRYDALTNCESHILVVVTHYASVCSIPLSYTVWFRLCDGMFLFSIYFFSSIRSAY